MKQKRAEEIMRKMGEKIAALLLEEREDFVTAYEKARREHNSERKFKFPLTIKSTIETNGEPHSIDIVLNWNVKHTANVVLVVSDQPDLFDKQDEVPPADEDQGDMDLEYEEQKALPAPAPEDEGPVMDAEIVADDDEEEVTA